MTILYSYSITEHWAKTVQVVELYIPHLILVTGQWLVNILKHQPTPLKSLSSHKILVHCPTTSLNHFMVHHSRVFRTAFVYCAFELARNTVKHNSKPMSGSSFTKGASLRKWKYTGNSQVAVRMHATITSKAGRIDVERERLPRKGRVETCHECLGGPLSHSCSVQNSFHSDVWPSHVSSCLQWPHRDKYLNAPWHPRQRFRSRDEKKRIWRLIMIDLEKFKALTFVQNENRKLSLLMRLIIHCSWCFVRFKESSGKASGTF